MLTVPSATEGRSSRAVRRVITIEKKGERERERERERKKKEREGEGEREGGRER